jgi:ATP-dependent Clp protease, protease subunit
MRVTVARINRDHVDNFFERHVDLGTRTIYFGYGEETEEGLDHILTADVMKGLHLMDRHRRDEPVLILINNQGGDVQHGLAIYDRIQAMKCEVTAEVWGSCYSMASWVLQAADVRRMSRCSNMMIHDGEQSLNGKKKDMVQWQKFDQERDKLCEEILLRRMREKDPSISLRKLQKMLATDTILWPQQALELGLIDEIIE